MNVGISILSKLIYFDKIEFIIAISSTITKTIIINNMIFGDKYSNEDELLNSEKNKIIYPTWKSLLTSILDEGRKNQPQEFNPEFVGYQKMFERLDMVNSVIADRNPVNLMKFLADADGFYSPVLSLEEACNKFKSISVRRNEFFAIFDLYNFRHREVDNSIKSIFGLDPEDFNLPAMAGLDPMNPLFHIRDNNHVMRWASISYFTFTIDLFRWKSLEDQYRIRFRVGTKKSDHPDFKHSEYAALEKLCFLFFDRTVDGSTKPIFHFDKWLVYNEEEFQHVRPSWISTRDRQTLLNNFIYLINAYIIGIPTQYILLLNEKQKNDRNKAITLSLNEQMQSAGYEPLFEEQQVADCFAKTIRRKIANSTNKWDFRLPNDQIKINSDLEAVNAAKVLGLLPIPESLQPHILSGITIV